MAMDDNAVLIASNVHILTGVVDTAVKPTLAQLNTFAADLDTPPVGWTDLGHTSLENVTAFGQDGGETEVKGSIQNRALRELITEAAVDYFTANSLQILDNEVLSFYYGGGDSSVADEFALPDNPAPVERALCAVFLEGTDVVAFYASKASIRREESIETPSDDFMEAPLRFTPLKQTGQPKAIWIGEGLGTTI